MPDERVSSADVWVKAVEEGKAAGNNRATKIVGAVAGGMAGVIGTGITAVFEAGADILPYDGKRPNEVAMELWETNGKVAAKGRELGSELAGAFHAPKPVRDLAGIAVGASTLIVTGPAALVVGTAKFGIGVAKGAAKTPRKLCRKLKSSLRGDP